MEDEEKNHVYRGEGIQNLVLANCKEKKVYRLMKLAYEKNTNNSDEEERSRRIRCALEERLDYVKNVMQPQLSSHYVPIPKLTEIPKGFVEKVEAAIQHARPAHRKQETKSVDPATCSALVLPDLCFVTDMSDTSYSCKSDVSCPERPTISVEIKPKKGFMPLPGTLPKESAIKYDVCKFCMHQQLKAKEGRWTKISNYCPLDLFSGNRKRMKHALLALCNTPQNNLKICKDGCDIYSDHTQEDLGLVFEEFFGHSVSPLKNGLRKQQDLHTFLDLLIDALLHVPGNCSNQPITESSHDIIDSQSQCSSQNHLSPTTTNTVHCSCSSSCSRSHDLSEKYPVQHCSNSKFLETIECIDVKEDSPCLREGCVLESVLKLQKLDHLDIEGVYPQYRKVVEHIQCHPEDQDKWYLHGPFNNSSWLDACVGCDAEEDKGGLEYAVRMVKRHNVSKTMQDCSIMVAMQRVKDQERNDNMCNTLTDCCGRKFIFSANIIDLDPKPFDKIEKYCKLESSILQTYREQMGC